MNYLFPRPLMPPNELSMTYENDGHVLVTVNRRLS